MIKLTKKKEAIIYLVISVSCLLLLFFVLPAFIPPSSGKKGGVSSAFFPNLALVIIMITSIVHALSLISPKNKDDNTRIIWSNDEIKHVAIIFAACFIYVFVGLRTLGFYISSPIFLIGVMWYLGERSKKKMVLISISVILALHVLMSVILQLKLPNGLL